MTQENDAGYKLLFSAPQMVRDLVLGFIPDAWLQGLDYNTLEKMPGSYVTDDFRHRADDVVWRVKADGEWIYLYILLEFQSTVDAFMSVRMMVYIEEWLQNNQELKRLFAIWIRAVLLRRGKHHLALPKVNDLKELKMGLAERLDTWEREFEERGMEKGLQKGEALALQRLLAKRFGVLPTEITTKIAAASAEQVETWLDRVLEAESLESLFL